MGSVRTVYPDHPPEEISRHGRWAVVLLISLVFHTLLFWMAGRLLIDSESGRTADPKPLHLRLLPATPPETEPQNESTHAGPLPERPTQSQKRQTISDTPATTSDRLNTIHDTNLTNGQPTTATILATARDLAHSMASLKQDEQKPGTKPEESALERALNAKREPAGVKELADGTIRVVTEYGLVYCVRPGEEWRFPGPGEVLPMNMACR